MTIAGGKLAQVEAAGSDAGAGPDAVMSDWEAVRQSADIQYAPMPPMKVPPYQTPWWLEQLGRLLEAIFGPIGRFLGMSWPVFQYVLIGLAVGLALLVLHRLFWPFLSAWRGKVEETDTRWAPVQAEALALLDDAEKLAATGHYDEAVHLLLRRSVGQIRTVRPDWLHPSSTAREIAGLAALPPEGRVAFGTIADRVERSRYALRSLDLTDWAAARDAYASFAKVRLAA